MILNSPIISGSLTVTGNILTSGSITLSGSVASASFAATSSFVALAQSASNAVAAATASSADNFLVRNTLTAQTLVVQTITSSVSTITGSTNFGTLAVNTHVFTGSMFISGSTLLVGNSTPAGTERFGVTRDDGEGDGLHIIADFNRAGNTSAELILGYYANGTSVTGPVVYAANSQPLLFAAGSGEKMRLATTGNLGIGLTNPSEKLDISGSAKVTTRYYVDDGTNVLELGSSYIQAYLKTGAAPTNLQFYTGLTERMRITPAGNVGINTTSPVSTDLTGSLTVVKRYQGDTPTSTTAQLYYTNQSALYLFGRNSGISIISNNNEEGHIQFGNASTTRYARITTGTGTSAVGGDMYFHVGSDTERMRITTGGNVGIGTNNPLAKLEVKMAGDGDMFIGRYSGGSAKLVYAYQSGADGFLELRTGADGIITKLSGYSGTPSYFLSNVLVGQTTPDLGTNGWQLQTAGGGHTAFAINNNEAFIFNNRNTGTTYQIDFRTNSIERGAINVTDSGTSYATTSDYRVKEDFKDFNGLEKISAIKVYDFKFKDLDERMDGVIAHELQEVLPYAVYGEKDGAKFQGVDYSRIVPVLIKSIQELKSQNDSLQSQINELKA